MSPAWRTASATLAELSSEWEELAERTAASPFVRAGWVAAWWNAFGEGRLEVRTVRDATDGRLAALVPLRSRGGVLGSPTNWHSPAFGLLAESDEAAGALLAALYEGRPRRVSLAFLDAAQASLVRRDAEGRGYRVIQRTLQSSPYVTVEGDWEDYRRGLGKNLRGDLQRRERLLAARGKPELEVVREFPDGARLDALLEQGFALEAAAWKGASGTAIASSRENRAFYTEVARWAAARGWLVLAFLRLDGRALAFDFCLEHAGVHAMLKTGYDPAFGELSPGKLLRQRMLARAFEARLRSYEMLGAAEPYKLQWAKATRARELVQGFRPTPLGTLDWALFAHARPLAKRLRELARGARAGAEPSAPRRGPASVSGGG